jgi:hypothetical protein
MDSDDNKASWSRLVHYVDDAPDHPAFNRLNQMVSPILHRAIRAQFDSLFDATCYFDLILFFPPTKNKSRSGPRVTVELRSPADPHLYISLCDWDIQFQSPAQCARVMPDEAFPIFTRYLQHLWEETIPEPIPEILRRRENYDADSHANLS